MKTTVKLSDLPEASFSLAGGKGLSLVKMMRAGLPVPQGFIILSNAFNEFLEINNLREEINLALSTANKAVSHSIEEASVRIQNAILSAKLPQEITQLNNLLLADLESEFVAVRSSATAEDSLSAAWAGQLESYLNTTSNDLVENIRKCWVSLFTPRAIYYRLVKDYKDPQISVAVVIQKMVDSEKSGIAFSVHPVTKSRDHIIIEAGFGLGEAVVSGKVSPDSYVVDKLSYKVIDRSIRKKTKGLYRAKGGGNEWRYISEIQQDEQVLTEKEIEELTELVVKVENLFGFPVDIEWAIAENGKVQILQARPITTLAS